MARLAKTIFWFTVVWTVFWLVPSAYDFLFVRPQSAPFTLYSTVTGGFGWISNTASGSTRAGSGGVTYTREEFDSIFPLFYYRQLVSEGRFPDTLNGVHITPQTAQVNNFSFKISPLEVNAPKAKLYPLLESMSGRVELEMPDDVFRITNEGIEFIDMASNKTNYAKSRAYTEVMLRKGFIFPAQVIAGNPTVKKDYDEGYLITDSRGKLFHLKQVKGRPYFRAIATPDSMVINHVFATEFRSRCCRAFIVDDAGGFFVLLTDGYTLRKAELPPFDPTCESMTIIGNQFDWTVTIASLYEVSSHGLDAATFEHLATMEHELAPGLADKLRTWVMPLRLSFTSPVDPRLMPRLNNY